MSTVDLRRLLISLCALLPIPLTMVLVSFLSDPAGLYHDVAGPLAEEWARTGRVRIHGNLDERLLQVEILKRAPSSVDGLILGSSRSLQVKREWFPGRTTLNLSVSGASLEDDLALFEAARERGIKPALVVLCADPWLMNRNSGQDRWKSVEPQYLRAIRRLGLKEPKPQDPQGEKLYKAGQLLSPSYFQESLKSLWNLRKGPTKAELFTRVVLADGSTEYPEEYTSKRVEDVRAVADRFVAKKSVYALENFHELDADALLRFETFIKSLRAGGTEVLLILPPYHPRAYAAFSTTGPYARVPEVERWFRTLAEREGVRVVGSYDPSAVGFTEADFLDGMHARESALTRLFTSKR